MAPLVISTVTEIAASPDVIRAKVCRPISTSDFLYALEW